MRAFVLGASAGLGRALTEALAARGDDLLLVASDPCDLEAQAAHLRLVYGVKVEILATDAAHTAQCLEHIRTAAARFGAIDAILFPIGLSLSEDCGTLPLQQTQQLINVNLLTVVGAIGQFLPDLLASNFGSIVGFSSVAATRGRGANIVYAAAKRGLESYFESLRHLTAHTEIRVQLYRLGYVATQQSFGQHLLFPVASPEVIAETVLRNLRSDRGLTYLPRYWAILARIVSALPWPIFKRLNF